MLDKAPPRVTPELPAMETAGSGRSIDLSGFHLTDFTRDGAHTEEKRTSSSPPLAGGTTQEVNRVEEKQKLPQEAQIHERKPCATSTTAGRQRRAPVSGTPRGAAKRNTCTDGLKLLACTSGSPTEPLSRLIATSSVVSSPSPRSGGGGGGGARLPAMIET